MDSRSERWGQIVDEALLSFRITTDNLTPATPPNLWKIGNELLWSDEGVDDDRILPNNFVLVGQLPTLILHSKVARLRDFGSSQC